MPDVFAVKRLLLAKRCCKETGGGVELLLLSHLEVTQTSSLHTPQLHTPQRQRTGVESKALKEKRLLWLVKESQSTALITAGVRTWRLEL